MSKKSKRQVSRQYISSAPVQASRTTEFNPDYTNVKHDLRRIGFIAAGFVGVLIILSIFQNQLLALFVK
jgi:hypothetical protein